MRHVAVGLTIIMTLAIFSGCTGTPEPEPEPEPELDWEVHYAVSGADLPACNSDTMGRLYYVESDDGFQVCKSNGWNFIDISGPEGPQGPPGVDGADGEKGDQGNPGPQGDQGEPGQDGSDGADGSDGLTPLFVVSASTACPSGGRLVGIGYDEDGDGELSSNEVGVTVDICNGADGADGEKGDQGDQGNPGPQGDQGDPGQDGSDGTNGTDGAAGADGTDGTDGAAGSDGLSALVSTSTESAGANCASGGTKIEVGMDDNGNGVLDAGEVDQTQYVCNGADGADGTDGQDGSASTDTLLSRISTPTLQACSSGGRIIEHGLDNGDGSASAIVISPANTAIPDNDDDGITDTLSWTAGGTVSTLEIYVNITHPFISDLSVEVTSPNGGSPTTVRLHNKTGGSSDDIIGWYPSPLVPDQSLSAFDGQDMAGTWSLKVVDSYATDTGTLNFWGVRNSVISTPMNGVLEDGEVDYTTTYCSNFVAAMVGDLMELGSSYPGLSMSGSYHRDDQFAVSGTRLYFDAFNLASGRELWAHETTNSSSWLAADICSGSDDSNPGALTGFTVVDYYVYFDASCASTGSELWAHSVLSGSTYMLTDSSGSDSSYPGDLSGLISYSDRLYFSMTDGSNGYELWALGTSNWTTWMVADINPSASSWPGAYAGLTMMGSRIYFDADDGTNGVELWAYEESNDTAWLVTDINPSGSSYLGLNYLEGKLTVMGTRLYFNAYDGTNGYELWAHETVNGSTWMVADIYSGSGNSCPGCSSGGPQVVGTRLLFDASDGTNGYELWAHETVNGSTWMVADINPSSSSGPGNEGQFKVVGTKVYFDASDGPNGREIWVHETANGSTWMVTDFSFASNGAISWSACTSMGDHCHNSAVMGTRLYMALFGPANGIELWVIETTDSSAWEVANRYGDEGDPYSHHYPGLYGITPLGNRLYYDGNTELFATELWMMEIDHTITYG